LIVLVTMMLQIGFNCNFQANSNGDHTLSAPSYTDFPILSSDSNKQFTLNQSVLPRTRTDCSRR